MKLLEQTVRELKGEEIEDDVRATVNLRVDLRIDESLRPRHEPAADALPRRSRPRGATRRSIGVLEEVARPLRPAARLGAQPGRLRPHPACMADRLGIESIDREGRIVVLKFRPQAKLDPVRLVALVQAAAGPDARPACGAQARRCEGVEASSRAGQPAPGGRSRSAGRKGGMPSRRSAGGRPGRRRAR